MKRTVTGTAVLLVMFLLGQAMVHGQESTPQDRTRRSWSLEFRTDRPQLYIHENAQGERTPYLYITYTLRNNYGRKVPLQMNFVLKTGEETYRPATANPTVEHEIIKKEARLSGFSKGVQRVKIKNLKKEGRYLTVDDLRRGFYLQHVKGKGLKQHDIQPLRIRSIGASNGSKDRIPYQVLIRKGPSDRSGKPYEQRLSDHPAEIKGLLLFEAVDLNMREFTLKVGDLVDPIVRFESTDVPEPKKYRLEPRTLKINWSWKVPRTNKRDVGPEFVGREMVRERFGPVVSRETLRRLIDYLSVRLGESISSEDEGEVNQTMRGTALQTLRDLTGQNFGYKPSASVSENKEALERWNEWWGRNKNDLIYILAKRDSEGAGQDLFHTYPQPRYIAVKKRVGVTGADTPQKLFVGFRSAWNNQRWQEVMDHLINDQRNRETMKTLFERFGFGTEMRAAQSFKEGDRADRRVVSFDIGEESHELRVEQEGGQWYVSIHSETSGE